MRLDLKCQADAFEAFRSGQYKAVVVEGKRKTYDGTACINLRDILVVTNSNPNSRALFEVSQVIAYWGAATLDTALQDVKLRLGPESFYLAPNEKEGFLPMLYDGIHALIIKPHIRRTGEGGKYGGRAERTDN